MLSLLLLACTPEMADVPDDTSGADTGADDTAGGDDTGADTGDDTGTWDGLLVNGYYTGSILAQDSSSCGAGFGDAFHIAVGTSPLAGDASGFVLDFGGGLSEACTYGEAGTTCEGYSFSVALTAEAVLDWVVTVPTFEATSASSFDQEEDIAIDCAGADCQSAEADGSLVFPCTVPVQESWSQ